ncbi:MAG: hypothetical protein Q9169_006157 [Polycauliona sp. 2 TL-2023]
MDTNGWTGWRSRVEGLFQGLDKDTGTLVKSVAIPDFMTYDKLDKILQHCANLEYVDFTGIEDSLENCQVRNDLDRNMVLAEMSNLKPKRANGVFPDRNLPRSYWSMALIAPLHGFRWSVVLVARPGLFNNLKSIAVNFDLRLCHRYFPFRTERNQDNLLSLYEGNCLPHLLRFTPQLQSLTLYAQPSFWIRERSGGVLRNPVGYYSSPSLKTLTLVDFGESLVHFGESFASWELLEGLEVLKISLHRDIYGLALQDCDSLQSIPGYVDALMAVCSQNKFIMQSCNGVKSARFAIPLQNSLFYLQKSHLAFLKGIGWQPTFEWIDLHAQTGCFRNSTLIRCRRGYQRVHYSQEWLKDVHDFLHRVEETGIPVRIQLAPHSTRGCFFSDLFWDPGPRQSGPNFDVTKWLLHDFNHTLGHCFNEISMLWDPTLAYTDVDLIPMDSCERSSIKRALKRSRQAAEEQDYEILEKLAREAHGAAQLFDNIHNWFPNIDRLALYIPAPIYPSTDQEFIDKFLHCNDNETWEVQHHGSGGGKQGPTNSPRETRLGHRYEMDSVMRRYKITHPPSEILINAMGYPMIHRVFTKKSRELESGNSKYLKSLTTARSWPHPPHPPTVTDLLDNKDFWIEKPWMVILIKYCRLSGLVPRGCKADFALDTATIEELRQTAKEAAESVLYTRRW